MKKVIAHAGSFNEMKVGKSNSRAGAAKMELLSQRTTSTKISTIKRSRSFRASAKLMDKFRSHTNIRTAVGKLDSKSDLVSWRCEPLENSDDLRYIPENNSNDEENTGTLEINDLRGIVREVKNKLSLTEKTRRKNQPLENPAGSNHAIRSSCSTDDKSNNYSRNSRNNYWNSIDTHSYENPTFSLDGSLDSSVAECMYRVEPESDNFDKLQDSVNIGKSNKGTKSAGSWLEKKSSVTMDGKLSDYVCRKINCSGLMGEDRRIELDNLIAEEGEEFSSRNHAVADYRSGWIMSRGVNFRFGGTAGIKEKIVQGNSGKFNKVSGGNVAGLLAIAATKSHSFQGMEFLEGFGKKKQHQSNNQSNSLATNINPLTAQPSLNIHVHALFVAVEQGYLEKVRTILESTDVDVNSVNSDGLSALDVAVLSNNRALAKMLIVYGAREGNRFTTPESLDSHLASLLATAVLRAQELGGTPLSNGCSSLEPASSSSRSGYSTSQHNSLIGCGDDAEDKQLSTWERRIRALRKILLGFDQSRPPDTTFQVVVDVTGSNSIVLKFQESDVHDCSPICTKFKVQWSTSEDFSSVRGERELLDMKQRECRIDGLAHGQRYHLRAAAGNIKGWSRFVSCTPAHVTPSSWRDLEGKLPRYGGRLDQLETLFASVSRSEYAQETSGAQRRNHKKKTTTIKQLFTATSKFQKSLRRGIFLACLLYHEDKVLVTNEDFLPVIEVDETYSPSCMYSDFHWLMKVACTWDDVKSLRQDMEKSGQGSTTNHSRLKLLQAAAQMQAALCVQDLGQIYYKPLRDVHGTMVISAVNYVKTTKSVSILNGRWLPLNKVIKKINNQENGSVADILMSSIQSQMAYHQLSGVKLTRGLYLGYLKMQSSVDLVQVFVPAKVPNVLPHCKIRDNPHVSAEEWHYLKRLMRIQTSETSLVAEEKENATNDCLQVTEQQKLFVNLISATSRRLFSYMEVGAEDSHAHRLYDAEVIELTSQVSLIVIVPPAEMACSAPGTREALLQRSDLLVLPIQVFEMIHLSSYQRKMINLYSRLSCILELDTAQAQHSHREAFSSSELGVARERLAKLQDIQCRVNAIWKEARWLIDLITFARDRGNSGQLSAQAAGLSIMNLLNIDKNKNISNGHSLKRSLLQLPPRDPKLVKSSPGRGSWPVPNLSNSSLSSSSSTSCNVLTSELSRSEQQLPNKGANGQYTRKCSASDFSADHHGPNERNSGRSVPKLNGIMPLSKSEDSLLLTKYKNSPRNRSVTSLNSVSSASTSHSVNSKPTGYSKSFVSVPTSVTNTWCIASSATASDSVHSLNSNDDYSSVNSVAAHKSNSAKPTASVAAVATRTMNSQLDKNKVEKTLMPAPLPGILQVYAAYQTGLASGTSLKLHVTPRTTAREVIDLVVKQLNMAVVLKGQEGPIYTADELPNFCLVAVIGARERCLRDDFKPLQLQNPWKKGRLYVRQKHDVLAALEHSSKQTAYL